MSLVQDLTQFGLQPNEAKVYLACLKLGPDSVQQIAKTAKVQRVSAYPLLEQLIKKGFVHRSVVANKKVFTAYPPMKLYDLLGREQDKVKKLGQHIDMLVPELKRLMKTSALETNAGTNIIYYTGEEGLKNWASDALEAKGELLEWTKIENFSKPFAHYLETYYFQEKCKRQIPTRFIFLDTPEARQYVQTQYIDNPAAAPMKARFIAPDQFDTPGFSIIYNDRYSIALPKELRAVTVVDQLVADTQRKIWEFGWLHAIDEVGNKKYPTVVRA